MNVLQLFDDELKNKNWNIEQKVRYVYIRSCQLFTYDERYDLCDMEEYKGIDIEEIKDRIIDLENLDDNRIICTTYSKQVLPKLMSELLNVHCVANGASHVYNTIDVNGRILLADPTISSDLARVKMKLFTHGYKPMERDYNFDTNLEHIDKDIKYINEEYENYFLKQRIDNIHEEFIKETSLKKQDDFTIYKLYTIKELFEKYRFTRFYDAKFCISYLIKKFIQNGDTINKASLFDDTKDDIVCTDLYSFKLEMDILYFALQQIEDKFYFYEVTSYDAYNFVKSLKGINKTIMYQQLEK